MRKGFTLIELLAVIVILAIIALIATPIILGIINNAKEDSEKRSVENYAHAVELAVARYAAGKGGVIPEGVYETDETEKTKLNKIEGPDTSPGYLIIDYKGEKIDTTIEITQNGEIILTGASIDGGKNSYDYTESSGVIKNPGGAKPKSSKFKVTDDGILLHYERKGNETNVVVPAEVNGIKIKKIAANAFLPGDIMIFAGQGLVVGLNEKAEESRSLATEFGMEFAMFDELKEKNITINVDKAQSSENMYMKAILNLSHPDKIIYQYDISDYYLTNLDLSNAIYLEEIVDNAFTGYDRFDSNVCVGDYNGYIDCPKSPLKHVEFPTNGNLKKIGSYAFAHNQLTEISLPETVEVIGEYAFAYNKLENLSYPSNKTIVNEGTFRGNVLKKVIIPDDVTTIKSYMFEKNQLTEIVIPSGVTTLSYRVLTGNPLSKIIIKRANGEGMTFAVPCRDGGEVIYDPNYKVQ